MISVPVRLIRIIVVARDARRTIPLWSRFVMMHAWDALITIIVRPLIRTIFDTFYLVPIWHALTVIFAWNTLDAIPVRRLLVVIYTPDTVKSVPVWSDWVILWACDALWACPVRNRHVIVLARKTLVSSPIRPVCRASLNAIVPIQIWRAWVVVRTWETFWSVPVRLF